MNLQTTRTSKSKEIGNMMLRASQLRLSITLHRLGVVDLAKMALIGRKECFPNLAGKAQLVDDYLELHDKTKLDYTYFWNLVKYFGVNIQSLPKSEKRKACAFINELNAKDALNANMFFLAHRLISDDGKLTDTAEELRILERVCDVVERGMNPLALKEFGRLPARGSELLSDPTEIEIAQWLEKRFRRYHR